MIIALAALLRTHHGGRIGMDGTGIPRGAQWMVTRAFAAIQWI